MKHIKTVEQLNESIDKDIIILTPIEKTFLWNKMEVKKKERLNTNKGRIYDILKSDESIEITEEELISILNMLEYTMKKRIKDSEQIAPKGKYFDAFMSIRNRLPKNWAGVKYSSLSAKRKRDSKSL